MKNRTLWLIGAVAVVLAGLFTFGYCYGRPAAVNTSAFDASAARFDSLATALAERHQAALQRADSLQAVVAVKDSIARAVAEDMARAIDERDEATARVNRFAREQAGVGGAKGAGDLQAALAISQAERATGAADSLVAVRDSLLREQIDLLREENATLRKQLLATDSVLAQANTTIALAKQANEGLEAALRRAERGRALWRGAAFASAGAAVTLGVICAARRCM